MCKDYRDSHLYKQLNYMHSILDIDKQLEGINDKEKGFLFIHICKSNFQFNWEWVI